MKTYIPFINVEGTWKRMKPIIFNVTNMGKIPSNALLTSEGVPFLTAQKEFFLVDPSTPGLTAASTNDFLLEEALPYTAKIF